MTPRLSLAFLGFYEVSVQSASLVYCSVQKIAFVAGTPNSMH